MKIKIILGLLLSFLIGTFLISSVFAKNTFYYGAWLPFWQKQAGATDISLHTDNINEISPFSYEIVAGGKILDDLKISSGNWNAWFSSLKELNIKNIPTIAWFDTNGIYTLLSNTKNRQAEEDAVRNLVVSNGFDGIDIDFESMSPKTAPYYSLFIQGLTQRLHPLKKTLTCTVVPRIPVDSLYINPPTSTPKYAEDYSVLNKYCDEVRLMAYDQGPNDVKLNVSKGSGTFYAPVADPDWVVKVLDLALKQINPQKVMLGVPTYGYEYQISWKNGVLKYQRLRSFTFQQAMDRGDSIGMAPVRNNAGELSYLYASTTFIKGVSSVLTWNISSTEPAFVASATAQGMNTLYISFPDASSTQNEINLAKKYNLRGIILFKADGQFDPATWGVMK